MLNFSVRAEFIEDFNTVIKVYKDTIINFVEIIIYYFEN